MATSIESCWTCSPVIRCRTCCSVCNSFPVCSSACPVALRFGETSEGQGSELYSIIGGDKNETVTQETSKQTQVSEEVQKERRKNKSR